MKYFMTLLLASLCYTLVWAAQPVNINTATAEEIANALNGIGMSKAELIVAYREQNGAFKHVDELVNVKGIGIRTVDRNKDMILLRDDSLAKKD